MFDNAKEPVYADFNGMEEDGAIFLGASPFDNMHLQKIDFVPMEGGKIWISDGDVEEIGILSFREAPNGHKYWASITVQGSTKSVPIGAWYHRDNLSKK